MAVSSLKNVLVKANAHKTGIIKRLLHAHVGGYEKPRSKKHVHASDLTKQDPEYCPRRERLLDLYPDVKDKGSHIDTALQVTFHEGRDKQARLNDDWLRDRMVGDWRCAACKRVATFCTYAEAVTLLNTCPSHTCVLRYEEMRVEDPVTGASGGLDALIIVKAGEKLRLVEFKIIATSMFKDLKAPLAEHKVRTQLYLRMLAKSKQPWTKQVDTSEASVLYQLRGHGAKDENGEISPFREFTVKRDHKGVEEYSAKAHALTATRRHPELGHPCGTCKTMMSPDALRCPVAKHCFSSKHPATVTWTRDGTPMHTLETVKWIANGTDLKPRED